MKKIELVYSTIAREEFKEAAKWYEESEPGIGSDLEKEVTHKIEIISNHPERYPARRGYYRETPIKKFPFLVIYRYNKSKHLITILSIHHTKRNPKNKYRK